MHTFGQCQTISNEVFGLQHAEKVRLGCDRGILAQIGCNTRSIEGLKPLDISTNFAYPGKRENHLPTECLLSIGGQDGGKGTNY